MESNPLPPFSSSPVAALRSVVNSPDWVGNLLWLSLAALSSGIFVGQICLFGYGADLLAYRSGRPENQSIDVDSTRIGDYLTQGIWPFLVHFVVQFLASILIVVPIMVLMMGAMAIGGASGGDEGAALSVFLMMPFIMVLSILASVVTVPFLIRGMVCQDFAKAFDFNWVMGFVRIMFWEIIISSIIFGILSMGIVILGLLMFCVGYIPAIGLVMGGSMNLLAQWYEVYLSRGGEPAPGPDDVIEATAV